MKIDYLKKAKVLASGMCDIEKFVSKTEYDYYYKFSGETENRSLCRSLLDEIYNDEDLFGNFVEAGKINHAFYKRKKRLFDTINAMVNIGKCIFVTLTFSDDSLERLSYSTRRRYVTNFLKSQSDYYVANIDYGELKGREHYHAVILIDKVDFSDWLSVGFIFAETVRNHTKDCNKLSQYVSKLTNHAIKVTTKRQTCIYSKKVRELVDSFKRSPTAQVVSSKTDTTSS